jgi:hypothetical protein
MARYAPAPPLTFDERKRFRDTNSLQACDDEFDDVGFVIDDDDLGHG